jgi:hypothetical protein
MTKAVGVEIASSHETDVLLAMTEAERFGVGWATGGIEEYDLEALGAAWYLNWGVHEDPAAPNGALFMQTVRLKNGEPRVSDARLRELVRANPGAVWQIGNEPDSPFLDDTRPKDYAAAYHDLYQLIKAEDPTARVANGGLVQATPLRLAYLERIWEAYEERYDAAMPVDVWTVHGFILREEAGGWGAEIPPGMSDVAELGMPYELEDHDDLAIFAEQIERFRGWMAEHGQRDRPLVVNEYGILMPPDYADGFGDDVQIAFLEGTFDYFRTATDPEIGCPADGNRLVQRWAWYSLCDDVYRDGMLVSHGYNGDLFTGASMKTMTPLGRAYGRYAVGDLVLEGLSIAPPALRWAEGAPVTATVTVQVRKDGGLSPTGSVDVELVAEGTVGGETREGWTVGPLDEGAAATLSTTLVYTTAGVHPVTVHLDPTDTVNEMDEGNNGVTGTVLVATDRAFLPVVAR